MELLIAIAALVALDILAVVAGHDSGQLETYALQELRVRRSPRDEVDRLLRRG